MRIFNRIMFLAFIFAGISAMASCATGEWKVGDRVMANWSGDNYWYPGTITKAEGGQYYIVYMDGDEEWLAKNALMKEDLKVGDAVEANWLGQGVYYSGKITSRNGDQISITYDDGDTENTSISVVRILK